MTDREAFSRSDSRLKHAKPGILRSAKHRLEGVELRRFVEGYDAARDVLLNAAAGWRTAFEDGKADLAALARAKGVL